MYRGKQLRKLLCMLITFSLLISGSAFHVLAASPEDGILIAAGETPQVGAGLTEEDSSISDIAQTELPASNEAQESTAVSGIVDGTETVEDFTDVSETDTNAESTDYTADSAVDAAGDTAGSTTETTDLTDSSLVDSSSVDSSSVDSSSVDSSSADSSSADSSSADSSLTDSSLTDSSLTDSSLTDSSLAETTLVEEDLMGGARDDIKEGLYVIHSALNAQMCIGIKSSSRSNGGNVELVKSSGAFSQAFYIKKISTGVYSFINYNSGKAMHVKSAGKTVGTNVMQYTVRDSAAQKWIIKDAATSGYVTIQPSYSKLMLDCNAGKSAAGTNLHLNKAVSAKRQMWKLVPASGKVAAEARLTPASISKGYYTIGLASATSQVLDVPSASKTAGSNIQIYKSNGTYAQAFQILPQGNNLYKVKNVNSGLYLGSSTGSCGVCNLVQKKNSSTDKSQLWYILKDPNTGKLVFKPSGAYHAVMSVDGNKTASGTNVSDSNFTGRTGQYWVLTKTTVYIKNAVYKPANGIYYICPAAAKTKALGVSSGKLTNSANVQLTTKSTSNAVKWRIYQNDDGTYSIYNVKSGKVLDIAGANFTSGANIQQYTKNGTSAQKWIFRRTGDKNGSIYITSMDKNLVVDITGARFKTGSNIWLYTKNNTSAQKYFLTKTGTTYSGWVTALSGNRYYYASGKRVVGWRKIGSYYYYFRSTGIMAKNTTIEGYSIDSEGISNKTDFKTATGGRTIRALLTNAVAPCGKVLYIWGGGWGGMGDSIENDSSKIGMLPTWTTFYNNHKSSSYDYTNYRFNYGMGLDCSGFTAWTVYNTIYDRDNVEDIVASSSGTAAYYISRGWCYDSGNTYKPGDVVCRSGHVWISMGTCEDGSVLIMNSTPQGVQLCGTYGKSVELAVKYMKLVAPDWPFPIHQNGEGYLTYVGKATWKVDGTGILTDPDGMQKMTAEQVCKIVFGA